MTRKKPKNKKPPNFGQLSQFFTKKGPNKLSRPIDSTQGYPEEKLIGFWPAEDETSFEPDRIKIRKTKSPSSTPHQTGHTVADILRELLINGHIEVILIIGLALVAGGFCWQDNGAGKWQCFSDIIFTFEKVGIWFLFFLILYVLLKISIWLKYRK